MDSIITPAYASRSRPVLSFGAAVAGMEEQTELACLIAAEPERAEIYREVVRIAADVYCRGAERPVVIDGEDVTFGYLQELYGMLTSEHVRYVVDNLERYPAEIKYKKAFLRTALANAVLEMHTAAQNEYTVHRL